VWTKSKKENQIDERHWSSEQRLTALVFWLLWLIYVCVAGLLIAAMFTNWPAFLHEHAYAR
jgi:hypothetical protein